MTGSWTPPAPSPIDDVAWPERLVARAIDASGPDPRLHGYAILGDLARHHALSDTTFLALTGELPDVEASRKFAVAMHAWAAVSVAEAAGHVAVLSRMCGGTATAATTAGILALGERARTVVSANAWLFEHLSKNPPVPQASSAPARDEAYARALAEVSGSTRIEPWMSRDEARLTLLVEAGIREPDALAAAIVIAGTNGIVAETLRATPADLAEYPITLPPFHYTEAP